MQSVRNSEQSDVEFRLVPPDGGWGYIVTISVIILNYATVAPLLSFGILYGPFLESFGNETSGTSMTTSTFVAVSSLTGFISSVLLRKYSPRMTGLVGATFFSLGYFLEIFGHSLLHMIIFYGFFKGFGYGLLIPSWLTIMNSYFDKKHNLMMGVTQTTISVGTIVSPPVVAYLMEGLGFKKTLMVLGGLSLLNFPAVATFRPVRRCLEQQLPVALENIDTNSVASSRHSEGDLLRRISSENGEDIHNRILIQSKKPTSHIFKHWILNIVGLGLLGDFKYISMAVGLALPFVTDGMFCTLIRMFLHDVNFEISEIALMMMVYFCFDVMAKITYSAVCGFYDVNNRRNFLVATFLIAVFRIAFINVEGYTWTMVTIGLIGFTKGFQETPLPLVISDTYKDNFSTAYSLYMVIAGFLFLVIGALTSYVRDVTKSDASIIYLFALMNFITCFMWISENIFWMLSKRKSLHKL
ncbi:monocarboxylate transporter 12-B [Leptinotarsa decemlineata]|uniref:monocarboxylate transporter 12-B n=1 Tax=Leptinotarsa decemlineata TaxID=7539 RepID=UPI003D30A05F